MSSQQQFILQLTTPEGHLIYFAEGCGAHRLYAVLLKDAAKRYTRAPTAYARRNRLLNSLPRGWVVEVVGV